MKFVWQHYFITKPSQYQLFSQKIVERSIFKLKNKRAILTDKIALFCSSKGWVVKKLYRCIIFDTVGLENNDFVLPLLKHG